MNYNNIKLLSTDFEEAVKDAKKGDFVYFDPPYDSDTVTFNSYTEDGFGKDEQKRLSEVFKELDRKGCYVMLSNHNTKLINSLYKSFYEVYKYYIENEELPSREFVKDIIRKYIPNMAEETVNRRASTIRGWIQWIIGAQV